MFIRGGLRAARHIRSRHAYASTRCAYGVADVENVARCRNGNERAQPSGSSWRPSRVAARLYCSNKSYHPAITASITSPRDEYILACSLSVFLFFSFERASTLFAAAVSCSIRARHTLSALSSPPNCLKLLLFLLFLLASPLCPATDNEHDPFSFYLLPLDVTSSSVSRHSRDTRSDLFPCSTE